MEGNIKDFDKNSQSVRPEARQAMSAHDRRKGECCPTTVVFSGAMAYGVRFRHNINRRISEKNSGKSF